jgi:acyl-coenzyme A thioesterase PaaI-like protein
MGYEKVRSLAIPVFGEMVLKRFEEKESVVPIPWASNKLGRRSKTSGGLNWLHGALDDKGVFVLYFFDKAEGSIIGCVHFGKDTEGANGRVHGGAILSVLDEAIGTFCGFVNSSGHVCVTTNLNVSFKKFVPINSVAVFETSVLKETDKIITAKITLTNIEGNIVHAVGVGEFFKYKKMKKVVLDQQDDMFDFPRLKWKCKL